MVMPGMCPAYWAVAGVASDVSANALAARSSLGLKSISIARSPSSGAALPRIVVVGEKKEAPRARGASLHSAARVILMVTHAVHVMVRMLLAHLVLAAAFFLFRAGLPHLGMRRWGGS